MAVKPRKIIDEAVAAHGPQVLVNLPAIALGFEVIDGYDPSDIATLRERAVTVTPIVHPLLAAQLDDAGATRRGRYSWVCGMGEDNPNVAPIRKLVEVIADGQLFHADATENTRGPSDLSELNGRRPGVNNGMYTTPAYAHLTSYVNRNYQLNSPGYLPPDGPRSAGMVAVSYDGRVVHIRVLTHFFTPEIDGLGKVDLNHRAPSRYRDPKPMYGAEAVAVADWGRAEGFTIVNLDGDDAIELLSLAAARTVTAWPTPGRPAQATAAVGRRVHHDARDTLGAPAPAQSQTVTFAEVTSDVLSLGTSSLRAENVSVHPGSADVAKMSTAVPVNNPDTGELRDYQRTAVGMHLATEVGFVNALAPGMGKTICSFDAMRRRAAVRPGYRALALTEANVRDQWSTEAQTWFPEATVFQLTSRSQTDELDEVLTAAGDRPVVVVTSYALATSAHAIPIDAHTRVVEPVAEGDVAAVGAQLSLFDLAVADEPSVDTHPVLDLNPTVDDEDLSSTNDEFNVEHADQLGMLLTRIRWDDLFADEAMGLRNTGTNLSRALWRLRDCAQVAVALTGTPIHKSLDDLGRMLAWCRNDQVMFNGYRLSKLFPDLSNPEIINGFVTAIGPLVFRRDKSEISDDIPTVVTEVERIEPTLEERTLASAARNELKAAYDELMSWLELAQRDDPDNPEFLDVAAQLRSARGALLGGSTLARLAASDPAALLTSESAGAALLASQGLIQAATQRRGSKRAWAVDYCTRRVPEGERILIFTEFSSVARGIIADLANDTDLRVGEVLGGGGARRDRHVRDFANGDLDVLVCTAAGERGLNLQTATTVIHYDLPWTPDGIVQRTGRVERIGATAETVKVVFPIMVGTIEERVAGLVVARAVTSMQALDIHRGVDASRTDMGRALSGLVGEIDTRTLNTKESQLLAITRELLTA